MEKSKKGKWMPRRIISWVLTVIIVVSMLGYGGIPGARIVHAEYGSDGDAWNFNFHVRVPVTGEECDPNPGIIYARDKDGDGCNLRVTSRTWSPGYTIAQPDTAYTFTITLNGKDDDYDPMPVNMGASVLWNGISYSSTYSPAYSDPDMWCDYRVTFPKTCSTYSPATKVEDFTYDATEHSLLNDDQQRSSPNNPRVSISYRVKYNEGEWGEWIADNPTAIKGRNAGTYTIEWKVEGEGLDQRKNNGTGTDANSGSYTVTISRRNINDDAVSVSLEEPDSMDESIYQYIYTGDRIQPEINLTLNEERLELNRDYNITDGDTIIEYINQDKAAYIISLRGIGNYIGVNELDWRVIRKSLGEITATKYEAAYDGAEHNMTVNLSDIAKDANAKITYIYDPDSSTDYTTNWDESKATEENPTFKNAGTYKVYYRVHSEEKDDSGEYIYNDFFGVQDVQINKKDVQLVPDGKTKVYDKDPETDPELTYQDFTSQLVSGETIEGVEISRETGQKAGDYPIVFNLSELNAQYPNYNFTQAPAAFKITPRPVKVSVGEYEKTYSEVNPTLELTIEQAGDEGVADKEGLLSGDVLVDETKLGNVLSFKNTSTGDTFAYDRFIDAGEYVIEAGTLANPNYDISFTEGSFTVNQKDITEEDTNVVVLYNGSRTDTVFNYTGKTITPDFTLSDEQDGVEYVNYESDIDFEVTGVYKASDYGVYKVKLKGIHNYTGEVDGQWAILPAVDEEITYDGKRHQLSFNLEAAFADSTVKGIRYSENEPEDPTSADCYDKTECPSYIDAGEHKVYYGIVLNEEEYGEEIVVPSSATLNIKKAPLAISVKLEDIEDREYDGTKDIVLGTVTGAEGLVNGETLSMTNLHGTFEDPDVLYGEDGSIIAKPITITKDNIAAATTKIIRESTAAEPEGGSIDNYEVTYNYDQDKEYITLSAKILPKEISVLSGVTLSKDYDGTTAATITSPTVSGTIEGETITINDPIATYDTKDVGTDKVITLSGTASISATGDKTAKLSNYCYVVEEEGVEKMVPLTETNISEAMGTKTGSITPKDLTATVSASDKAYDGTTDATVTATVETGIEGETFTITVDSANFDSNEVGDRTVNITSTVVPGDNTSLSNYNITVPESTDAKITKKDVSITAENKSKVYEEDDPELTWTVSELVGDDTEDMFGISIEREEGEDAGTYKITTTCDAEEYEHYKVTHVAGTFTIEKGKTEEVPEKGDITTSKASSTSSNDAVINGVDDTMEYSTDGGKTWTSVPKGATSITGVSAGNVLIRKKGDENHNPGEAISVNVPQKSSQSAPSSSTVKPSSTSGSGKSDGTITGVDDTMEYSTDGGKTWKSVPKGATSITGLSAGTVQIRKKATANSNAGEILTVEITSNPAYKNEWVKGQWYDKGGNTTYKPQGGWKKNSTGWWYEDAAGWYPVSQWQKIDGLWYYFDARGYMAANEWIDGWWLGSDGAWNYEPRGSWKLNSTGWWYEDTSGWYPVNRWQKIDGKWYYFNSSGYMLSSQNVNGYYVGSNGAWVE